MTKKHLIYRSERVRELKQYLKEYRFIYLSSFFYGGKTVLLQQFLKSPVRPMLWYDAKRDEWEAFKSKAAGMEKGILILDNLHMLLPEQTSEMFDLLAGLPESVKAVLAGRAQVPGGPDLAAMQGDWKILNGDFVLFDKEEINQLFLNYGITLKPAETAYLKECMMGWPYGLHVVARMLLENPAASVRTVPHQILGSLVDLLVGEVLPGFSEQERLLLYSLSPFEAFSEEMARMITGRPNAPEIMKRIADRSYMLLRDGNGGYSFIPFVQIALFEKVKNNYTAEEINEQYRRAALYCELQGDVAGAAGYYARIRDIAKLKQLLIHDAKTRPSNGGYVELRQCYKLLSKEDILTSPQLMKGMCMIESMSGCVEESEEWYQALKQFIQDTSPKDVRHSEAKEVVAYLDIILPHRGTKQMLKTLLATAKLGKLIRSETWKIGFNVGGNSVSLMNGGKDFSNWVPNGANIYRMFRGPVEMALGHSGRGIADIAMAECILESSLVADYEKAMELVCAGMAQAGSELETNCTATGIQSRILMARGSVGEASLLLQKRISRLPKEAPVRLQRNLEVYRLTLEMMNGNVDEALDWLAYEAPDEQEDFIILDRYCYMLKLRLYIMTRQWEKTFLLIARLKYYFEEYDRPYMLIQLKLMRAVIGWRKREDGWQSELTEALKLAHQYRLVRVIADEGVAILEMVDEMMADQDSLKELKKDEKWLAGVMELLRRQSVFYPAFMKSIVVKPEFSDREYQVYTLLAAGYDNKKIASAMNVSVSTVKYYLTEVYRKLDVKSRAEAVARHSELGDI